MGDLIPSVDTTYDRTHANARVYVIITVTVYQMLLFEAGLAIALLRLERADAAQIEPTLANRLSG
jgi:hypothetical protein